VEYRTMRMTIDKALPARILQRVEFVNAHKGSNFKLRCPQWSEQAVLFGVPPRRRSISLP
jgi:hypothetical protein